MLKQISTINYYPHINLASKNINDQFVCELEIINHITNQTVWKEYFAENKKKAIAIAKGQATRIENRLARIYG